MKKPATRQFRRIVLMLLVVPALAQAQDFGAMFRNAASRAVGDTVTRTAYSVTTASIGKVVQGAMRPRNTEGKVLLYATPSCGYCKKAAAYMSGKGIPFVERNIDADPSAKQEYDSYRTSGVPLLVFGSEILKGFNEQKIDELYARMPRDGNAPPTSPAVAQINAGDVLLPKLNNVAVLTGPEKTAERLGSLGKSETAVYMGEESNGYYRVTTSAGEGWVDKLLVARR